MTVHRYTLRMSPDPRDSLQVMLLRAIVNAVGLFLASVIVPGVHIGDWQSLVVGTAIFATANTFLKPLASMLSCCLIIVTFGLFALVINGAMLALSAWAAGQLGLHFRVDGFWAAVFGALVISIVSLIATVFTSPRHLRT